MTVIAAPTATSAKAAGNCLRNDAKMNNTDSTASKILSKPMSGVLPIIAKPLAAKEIPNPI